ncbi:MAG: hypothetical protein COB51_00395 [Moraxellaceae bacterium]|nr:MAG: hypothetical protein COB51_00395 [Moraxellaceae bacterium]
MKLEQVKLEQAKQQRRIAIFKFVLLAGIIAVTGLLYRVLDLGQMSSMEGVGDVVVQVRAMSNDYGAVGAGLFLMAGICAIILNIPTVIVIAVASAIYGGVGALLLGVLLLNSATTCIYFIGKKLGRDFIFQFFGRSINRLEAQFEDRGLITVIHLRLLFFALPPMNWFLSVMNLSYRDYGLGTLIGGLPKTVMYAWLGGTVFNALAEGGHELSEFYLEMAVPVVASVSLSVILKMVDIRYMSGKEDSDAAIKE